MDGGRAVSLGTEGPRALQQLWSEPPQGVLLLDVTALSQSQFHLQMLQTVPGGTLLNVGGRP